MQKTIAWLDETTHKSKLENLVHHWCNEMLKRYSFENIVIKKFYDDYNDKIRTAILNSDWFTLKTYCKYIDLIKGE